MAAPSLLPSLTRGLAIAIDANSAPHIVHRSQVGRSDLTMGPTTSRHLELPETINRKLISNLGEAVRTYSLSWIQDRGTCGLHLSERSAQSRLSEPGSEGQRRLAGAVGPGSRVELRRLLASLNDNVSGAIEERIQNLEKENVQMLLEVWRSKLEFARVKKELRCEVFRITMERILINFDSILCDEVYKLFSKEMFLNDSKDWLIRKLEELECIMLRFWGKIKDDVDWFGGSKF